MSSSPTQLDLLKPLLPSIKKEAIFGTTFNRTEKIFIIIGLVISIIMLIYFFVKWIVGSIRVNAKLRNDQVTGIVAAGGAWSDFMDNNMIILFILQAFALAGAVLGFAMVDNGVELSA
jgi:hypothetical protein